MRKQAILSLVLLALAALLVVVVIGVVGSSALSATAAPTPQPIENSTCGAAAAQVRTTLYFGTTRPTGAVSELEWQVFLRDEVTQRFPEGLTVWDAQGQWRTQSGSIDQERSKVLLLVHRDTVKAQASVQEVIERYRKAFQQESVLWETARVCVSS
jgi:hypothetical protein